ncbi:structural maintenance of chromosomes protein 1A isoform X2 [Hydra vulgaris]|uniref:Structural maintenance of chromosomes protein n=1 Tax=Hydra vulgaris TaxID=6087 RepID=A0ABM4D3X9_HYDVU
MPGYLEKLEIINFKSYKGKHLIGFSKFSAIIGPNGCGKSNMMDAISFVLGEKTFNLRVKSVKELIHGAPIKQPVATTAQVSAHYIDYNKDGEKQETVFCRKIIGSGTEYRINGKLVANKEYHSALEDIGILIKAKNFLVFQGAVESIAMKTLKERTAMFEKISGSGELIEEYDKKKQEMLTAEEDTTFSLNKKKGINAERKEARAEKEEAEKYKKLTQDLFDAKLQAQLFKLYYAEQDLKNFEVELKEHNNELEKIKSRKVTVETQLKLKKSEGGKFSREIALKDKDISEKEAEISKKQPLYLKAKQVTQHEMKKMEDANNAYNKHKKNADKQKEEIKDLEKSLIEIQKLAKAYEKEIGESQGQSLHLIGSQMAEYNQLKEMAGKETSEVQTRLDKINREQKGDTANLHQLNQRKLNLESRLKELKEERAQLHQRVKDSCDYIAANEAKLSELNNQHNVLNNNVNEANERYNQKCSLLEGVELELGEAKADKNEDARSQERAETVKKLKELYPGVYGRLVDLCEPVHKRYAIAITKVLGKYMDGIVVDTEKTGRECVQYMKEQSLPRETFMPLDTLKIKSTNEQLREIGGSAKLVIDIIKYDPSCIKKALQFSCGNSLVCDTAEEARQVAFRGSERRRTVSIDGTLFEKSGVISGGLGAVKIKAKRWDSKRINQLKQKRDEYQAELKELQGERRKAPGLSELKSLIQGLEAKLKWTKRDKETIENQTMTRNEQEMEVINSKIEEILPDIANFTESIKKREKEVQKIEKEKNVIEDQIFASFCLQIGVQNIRQYEETQLVAQQEKTEKMLQFQKQEGKLQNQIDYLKSCDHTEQMKKLEKKIKESEVEIEKLKIEEKKLLKDIDINLNELDKWRQEIQVMKTNAEKKDADIKETKKLLSAILKDESSVEKKKSFKERQIEEKRSDRHSLLKQCKMDDITIPFKKGSMNDIEASGNTLSQTDDEMQGSQGSVTYNKENSVIIDYAKLKDEYKKLADENEIKNVQQELTSTITSLESTISRIVAPNMKAVSRLDEVQNRLKETNDEFENTRKRAKKAKAEYEAIQKERYDKFMDAFEHVSQKIDEIYKELSNNSSAQAFLGPENGDEPYLEGISYNCVAPGKRFRPMDNLSGGEKTVAALALLFAIHSYQPSPFFVLDEIDAALDNTNINRVAKYIKKQTKDHFQCIVISLKDEFYTKVDSVIGVTADPDKDCTTTSTLTLDLTQFPES